MALDSEYQKLREEQNSFKNHVCLVTRTGIRRKKEGGRHSGPVMRASLAVVGEQWDQFRGRLELSKSTWAAGKRRGAGQMERTDRKGRQQALLILQCLSLPSCPAAPLLCSLPCDGSLSQQAAGLRYHYPGNRSPCGLMGELPPREWDVSPVRIWWPHFTPHGVLSQWSVRCSRDEL